MFLVSPKWVVAAVVICIALVGGGFMLYRATHSTPPAPVVTQTPKAGPVHTILGHTVEGRAINAYSYGTGSTHLLFVGGMHGGYEWNTVVLANDFKDYLDTHPGIVPKNLTVTIVPSVNVDGVYKIVGMEAPFSASAVPAGVDTTKGRLNANQVDLNRNFDCAWQPKATWRSKPVSAGTAPFSEPESIAIRDFILHDKPAAVVFWHSQSGSVYAAECNGVMAPHELEIMNAYALASGYTAVKSFDAYPVTGDSEGWLASLGIPALTVELTTHSGIEWEKNLAGFTALLTYFATPHTVNETPKNTP